MRRTARSHVVRRTAAVAVAALALSGLAACADDPADESGVSPTAATSSPDAAEEPQAGESVDADQFVEDVLGGLTDQSSAHVSMKVVGNPQAEMSAEGEVDYRATPPEMSMTMDYPMLGQGEIQLRLVDGAMYLRAPELGDGKWVKMPMSGDDSPFGEDLVDQLDPGAAIEDMKDAVDEVLYIGEEQVDGETLKHYEMTVNSDELEDLTEQFGGSDKSSLPTEITYNIWTDTDGLMRKTEMTLGDMGTITTTMSDWGEPVEIEAPPKSQVMKMPGGTMSSMS